MLSGPNGEQVAAGPDHTPLNKPMSAVARSMQGNKNGKLGGLPSAFPWSRRLGSAEDEEPTGDGFPAVERRGGLDRLHAEAVGLGR